MKIFENKTHTYLFHKKKVSSSQQPHKNWREVHFKGIKLEGMVKNHGINHPTLSSLFLFISLVYYFLNWNYSIVAWLLRNQLLVRIISSTPVSTLHHLTAHLEGKIWLRLGFSKFCDDTSCLSLKQMWIGCTYNTYYSKILRFCRLYIYLIARIKILNVYD